MSEWRVLVPLEVLEGETLPDALVEFLSGVPVVVLGYHVLPEQTPPGQARLQFEDQAQTKLDDVVAAFEAVGGAAETRLVFTHDEDQTVERVAGEAGCNAVLVPNPTGDVERILVPVRDDESLGRVADFVAALVDGRDVAVTVYDAAAADEAPAGRSLVEVAADRLVDAGVPRASIAEEVADGGAPVRAIGEAAVDHDVVVMAEDEPSLRAAILGETEEQVAAHSLGPVLVVRREPIADTSTT